MNLDEIINQTAERGAEKGEPTLHGACYICQFKLVCDQAGDTEDCLMVQRLVMEERVRD
jgi:hypothetical protein